MKILTLFFIFHISAQLTCGNNISVNDINISTSIKNTLKIYSISQNKTTIKKLSSSITNISQYETKVYAFTSKQILYIFDTLKNSYKKIDLHSIIKEKRVLSFKVQGNILVLALGVNGFIAYDLKEQQLLAEKLIKTDNYISSVKDVSFYRGQFVTLVDSFTLGGPERVSFKGIIFFDSYYNEVHRTKIFSPGARQIFFDSSESFYVYFSPFLHRYSLSQIYDKEIDWDRNVYNINKHIGGKTVSNISIYNNVIYSCNKSINRSIKSAPLSTLIR